MGGRGWAGWSGVGGGEWDNCNSIINKYIFFKKGHTITGDKVPPITFNFGGLGSKGKKKGWEEHLKKKKT